MTENERELRFRTPEPLTWDVEDLCLNYDPEFPQQRFLTAGVEVDDTIVTTDCFGFDDSTDHYGLQKLGHACDMGDAMAGQAMKELPDVRWYAIHNSRARPSFTRRSTNSYVRKDDGGTTCSQSVLRSSTRPSTTSTRWKS